jgi:hypothetical protein
MQFVLETSLFDETTTTLYSNENQALIMEGFNSGMDRLAVYHEIQEGIYKGKVVKHIIYLETRSVLIIGQASAGRGYLKFVPVTTTNP